MPEAKPILLPAVVLQLTTLSGRLVTTVTVQVDFHEAPPIIFDETHERKLLLLCTIFMW